LAQTLPGPGLTLPVDVDGDGVSTFGDQYTFNWWLANGGNLKKALSAAKVGSTVLDLSDYFAEIVQPTSALAAGGGQAAAVTTACNGSSEINLTERMPPNSLTTNAQQPTGGTSEHARVTPGGCLVVFSSKAGNLVGANGFRQVYRLEYQNGIPVTLTHMSKRVGGTSAELDCFRPSVSDDGQKVAFESMSRMGFSAGTDPDRQPFNVLGLEDMDIFVRDESGAPATRLLSITPAQISANGASSFSSISGDGTFVAFSSVASNFGGGFTPTQKNVYRASTSAPGGAEILSLAKDSNGQDVLSDGLMQTGEDNIGGIGSVGHVISPDGNVVAFYGLSSFAWAGNLSAAFKQVYVRDCRNPASKQTLLASFGGGSIEEPANGVSQSPTLSPLDGGTFRIAFSSQDTHKDGQGAPAGIEDVFLADVNLNSADIDNRVKISVTGAPNPIHGNAASIVPTLSRDGNFASFASLATNLVAGDTNNDRDVFVKKLAGIPTLLRSSVKTDGSQVDGVSVESTTPDVTQDGAAVVFESTQSTLVPGDTNGFRDVFRRFAPLLNNFKRGDANQDGAVNISDSIFMLSALFQGGPQPGCTDAADAQDDGLFDVSDPVFLNNHLFSGGPAPPAPFPGCGTDPTPDSLTCDSAPSCPQ
jgi:hypothetical protein